MTHRTHTYHVVVERIYRLGYPVTVEARNLTEARLLALEAADAQTDMDAETAIAEWHVKSVSKQAR